MAEKKRVTTARTGRTGRAKGASEDTPFERLIIHRSDDPGKNNGIIRLIEPLEDIPMSENYRADAARRYGNGQWYAFTPRRQDGTFDAKKRWAAECFDPALQSTELPDDESLIAEDDEFDSPPDLRAIIREELSALLPKVAPAPAPIASPQSSLIDTIVLQAFEEMKKPKNGAAELVGQLRTLEEARRLFAPREPNPAPIYHEPELTTEQALMKLIAEDPIALATVREKLLGGESESLGWLQIAQAFAPAIERSIATIATIFSQRQSSPVHANGAAAPAPIHDPQMTGEQPSQTGTADEQAYQRLIGRILSAMAMNGDIEPIVNALYGFCDLFPEHAQNIEAWMSAPAESLLLLINQNIPNADQATNAPHALDWTRRLQAAFFADGEETSPEGNGDEMKGGDDAQ